MKTLLLVEDGEIDIFLMKRAIELAGSPCALYAVRDGDEAIEYLCGAGRFTDPATCPRPDLIVLDVSMPGRTGLQVLEWIRSQPALKDISASVLTRSLDPADVHEAYRLGARAYHLKPGNISSLKEILVRMVQDGADVKPR